MPDKYKLRGDKQISKRRVIRVPPETDHPIRVDLMGNSFIEVIAATDISLAGVGINVSHGFEGYNLEDKAKILILLPPPVSHSISATVKIIHQRNSFFGAKFESLKRSDYVKLYKYIAYRLKNERLKLRLLHALHYFPVSKVAE